MVITAMLLAVGMILPFLTGQIQAIAKVICPLHIPVLICGLCCGWKWGLGLGIVLPLLRGIIFGIPVFPTSALPMAFELAAYGAVTGLMYAFLLGKRKGTNHLPLILCSLITARPPWNGNSSKNPLSLAITAFLEGVEYKLSIKLTF